MDNNSETSKNSRDNDKKKKDGRIDPEIKAKILTLIKEGSVRVRDAAQTYSVSVKTIYTWLSQTMAPGQRNSTEVIRLRRENKALLELIGKLTAELQKSKKKSW